MKSSYSLRTILATGILVNALIVSGCDRLASLLPKGADKAACGPDEICGADSDERVRAIKPFIVTQLASGSERQFSGEVTAANAAPLSFPVGGRVESINVAAGQSVELNTLVAALDAAPYQINVDAAQADVDAARAAERALATDIERQRELRANGWISQAAIEQAEVEYQSVRSQVSVAQSRLTLAERDLASTRLVSPFDGVVSSVSVEPFTEVRPGQTVVTVQSGEAFEVIVSVPDTIIGQITPGSPASIEVGSLPLCGCRGNVVEVGAVSSAGNAVDVVVAITGAPNGLRDGMSAEVGISLGSEDRPTGYFIPLAAIAPGSSPETATVFRFDPADEVVRQTTVRFVGSVAAEAVAVEGLEAGDVIAAAGVSFLRDGQRVRLLGAER